jgi:hypothetical protein
LAKASKISKGINENSENKKGNLVDSYHILDITEAMDSKSSDEEHKSRLASRYQVKLKEPKVSIDLNEPTPSEEFPEFKIKVRTDK